MLKLNSNGKAPIAIIIIAILVVGIGIGAFAFLGKSKGKGKKDAEITQWKFDEFIVNMADVDTSRYLKTTIVLGIVSTGDKSVKSEKGGNPMEAEARDIMISVMSKKRYQELLASKGKDLLKQNIKDALNAKLKDIKVVEVYFTGFAMQ